MKDQKFLGSLVTGLVAIGTLIVGAHQYVFSRTEGEAIGHHIDRIEDRMDRGFKEMRESIRSLIVQRTAKNTSMLKPIKKAKESQYVMDEDRYRELKAKARKEAGHELFSFGEPLDR